MIWVWDNLVLRPFKWVWRRVTGAPFDGAAGLDDSNLDDDEPRHDVTL